MWHVLTCAALGQLQAGEGIVLQPACRRLFTIGPHLPEDTWVYRSSALARPLPAAAFLCVLDQGSLVRRSQEDVISTFQLLLQCVHIIGTSPASGVLSFCTGFLCAWVHAIF